jgi:hypothetical protein
MAAVVVCLSNCARELRPGGRIIVRDIWSPEPGDPELALEMEPEPWTKLKDLLERCPVPLDVVDLDESARKARFSTQAAVEFLSKKDYGQHWDLELKEVYTSVPLSMYRDVAATLKLDVVHAQPVKNDWIVKNRWAKDVRGDLPEFTNQVIVLQK